MIGWKLLGFVHLTIPSLCYNPMKLQLLLYSLLVIVFLVKVKMMLPMLTTPYFSCKMSLLVILPLLPLVWSSSDYCHISRDHTMCNKKVSITFQQAGAELCQAQVKPELELRLAPSNLRQLPDN